MNASTLAEQLAATGCVAAAFRAVEPAYPDEGCCFVFEDTSGALEVLPTANRAPELHRRDPERYRRSGADWFEPDMRPWFAAARRGGTPRVIVHSHPEVGAYFSSGDHESALMVDEEGRLVERNPGVLHMVVSVRQAVADGARLYRFDGNRAFVEVASYDAAGALAAVS